MRKNWKIYLGLLVYAIVLMLLCAGSSPLIRYLSPDSSIFYTVGRSMARGRILYKEIADHKGFYLFLFNAIGAWLTPDSMNGIFIVEILFAWIKLVFAYKIASIYIHDTKKDLLTAMAFMAVATNFLSWNTGNLGEQFALAFQLISLYYMAVYVQRNQEHGEIVGHNPKYMMIHGICAGIVLFIQANLIAMWIPFGMGLGITLLLHKQMRNFFKNLMYLLFGVGIVTLPVILYGVINNCIEDMYYVMFEINFLYSADGRIGKSLLGYLREFLLSPSVIVVLLAVAGVIVLCLYYKKIYIILTATAMLLFSILCMSVSLNANPIYYTAYMPFMLPFFIWISRYSMERLFIFESILVLAATVAFNMQLMKKVFRIGSSSYAYESAYQMEKLIENKDAKVLVLGNSLYYNCTGTLPHIKYFTIFGSGLRYETFPYCIDEQFESLCTGENEYIMIQFNGDDCTFWGDEGRDEEMRLCLQRDYDMILEYQDGGIHSGLYKKQ